LADDLYIFQGRFGGRDECILAREWYSHNFELDGSTASVVNGEDGVFEIDIIDCYNGADDANIANGMVEVEVEFLA
jgi:hypothetical protein